MPGTGALSPEGLQNLRYYKYSSIDKSPLSNYVLKHYVSQGTLHGRQRLMAAVEWFRQAATALVGSKFGHVAGVLLHPDQRCTGGRLHT